MNNKAAVKAGVWYVISKFFVRGVGFIVTPILTRLLTKSEYGAYNNYLSWLAFFTVLITLNLEATLVSAKFDFKKNIDAYISSILMLSSISALIWGVVFFVFAEYIESLTGLRNDYLWYMLLYLMFFSSISIFQNNEQMSLHYKSVIVCSLAVSICSAIVPIFLVFNMDDKVSGMIIGSALPTIVIGAGLYIFLLRKGRTVNFKYWQYAIPLCLPYIPHLWGGMVLNSMDRIMINKWCGPEETALYSLAYMCGLVIMLLTSSINSSMAPWLCTKLDTASFEEIRKNTKYIILVFCYVAFGILLLEPELLFFLGGDNYMEAKYIIAPVVMGGVCQFVYTLFATTEQFYRNTKWMAIATVFAAGLNFILNWLFIPYFGYSAAAFTTLIGYLSLLLIHQYVVNRMNLGDLFDVKCINRILALYGIIMLGVMRLYDYDIIRFVIIFCYFAVSILVLKKKYSLIRNIFAK